jgi:hypothetical protein
MASIKYIPGKTSMDVTLYEVWKRDMKLATYQAFDEAWKAKLAIGRDAFVIRATSSRIQSALKGMKKQPH